ncbi:MAG TPA: hypothetical protein VGA61_18305, partial [Anaerolineae bacterium]
ESGSDIWAQANHLVPGGILTRDYQGGKLYVDEFRVDLPETMQSGTYLVEVGWYDPAGEQQLDVQPGGVAPPLRVLWRSVLLPPVTVIGQQAGSG